MKTYLIFNLQICQVKSRAERKSLYQEYLVELEKSKKEKKMAKTTKRKQDSSSTSTRQRTTRTQYFTAVLPPGVLE